MRCSAESWEAEEKCKWDSHLSCVPITWMCGAIKPEPRSCPCPAPGSDSPCTATAAKEGWEKLTKVVAGGNGTVIRFVFFTLKRFMKVSGTGIVQMSHEKGIATAICAHVLEHKPRGRACIRKHPGWRKCCRELEWKTWQGHGQRDPRGQSPPVAMSPALDISQVLAQSSRKARLLKRSIQLLASSPLQ